MPTLPKKIIFTGTQINYFKICKRKLWYFSHNLGQEQESETVELGKILQRESYRNEKKDLCVDSKISIDYIKRGDKLILHEVKKSKKLRDSHEIQLRYYLYYLKEMKGIKNIEGIIDYPTRREVIKINLSEDDIKELSHILSEINKIILLPTPPKAIKKPYCRKCSYFELCWI